MSIDALWVDASSGASGDMLLGALVGAGVPVEVLQEAIDAVSPEPVALRVEDVRRGGLAATRVHVDVADSHHHRTWRDVRALLDGTRPRAGRLRAARRRRGGRARHHPGRGALPRGRRARRDRRHRRRLRRASPTSAPTAVTVSPSRSAPARSRAPTARSRCRRPPSPSCCAASRPTPARAAPELCTPTGAALLTTLATAWGPQPAMTVDPSGSVPVGGIPRGTPTWCGCSWAVVSRLASLTPRPPRTTGSAAGVQRRRPRPAGLAGGDRGPARGRRLRRLADPDPDEEGPARAHAQRAGRRRPRRRRPRRRSSGRPRRSGCASSRSTKHALEREIVAVEVGGQTSQRQAGPPRRGRRQRPAGVRRRRRGPRPSSAARSPTCSPRQRQPRLVRGGSSDGPGRHRPDVPRHLRRRAARQDLPRDAGAGHEVPPDPGLDRRRPGLRGADPGRGAARPRRVVPARGGRAGGGRADVPGRRGDPDPRGPQPPGGGRRTRRSRPRTCTAGAPCWPASWCSSPPSGATCPSC